MISIFVAKLDFGVSQEELKSIFEKYGQVAKVTIATDRETGRPKGFAFVEMINQEEANKAIAALDNSSINGRQVAVKIAEERGSRPERPFKKEFNSEKPPFKREFNKPIFKKEEDVDNEQPSRVAPIEPIKSIDRKKDIPKKKEKKLDFNDGSPRAKKMETYKKSGKNNRYTDLDDDDY
jgi:RNA recognition motif-containing protein